jgi:hypothetical protein
MLDPTAREGRLKLSIEQLIASKAWRVYGPWVLPWLSVIGDIGLTLVAVGWPIIGLFLLLVHADTGLAYASCVASFWAFPFVVGKCFVARIRAEDEEVRPKDFLIRLAPIFTAAWLVWSASRI